MSLHEATTSASNAAEGRLTSQQALAVAVHWAERGVPAGPIAIIWDERKQATNKRPLTKNGHRSFTIDAGALADLFHPDRLAFILRKGEVIGAGLWPGPAGLVVLDPDVHGGQRGPQALADLEAEHGELPPHPIVDTASGGEHHWLHKPAGVHVGNEDLCEDINVRSDDGWVVAPGVLTPWGSWTAREGSRWPPPMWTSWLAGMLEAGRPAAPDAAGANGWQRLGDRSALDPLNIAALEALEALGGHDPYVMEDGSIQVVRPGKTSGASASVGRIGPGIVKVWTDGWEPLTQNRRYDVDELQALAAGESLDAEDGSDDEPVKPERETPWSVSLRSRQDRPRLHLPSNAVADDWLREMLGTGPLSGYFVRDEHLVHCPAEGKDGYVKMTEDEREHDGPAQVREADAGNVAARVTFTYNVVRGEESTPTRFPASSAQVCIDALDMLPHLKRLKGVTHAPLVRHDGTVLHRPGYDTATRLLYLPQPGMKVVAVPEAPTVGQVAAAVLLLKEMTAGFPFVSDNDRANYYGLLLTPVLRELVGPPYKAGIFTAPMKRSGKTLLASTIRILHGGVLRIGVPGDEDEWVKTLSTILNVTTGPVVVFDNVTGALRSGTLDGLLTSPTFDARQLGTTKEMIMRRNDRLWLVTSNNAQLGGDLVPRSLWVSIDPREPHPERRTGFAIDDLPTWVHEHRGELLAALLTLVRWWFTHGKPTEPAGDIYGRWVGVVRGILFTAGIPGVFDSPESVRQTSTDEDDEAVRFLAAVAAACGERSWSVSELLNPEGDKDPFADIVSALPTVVIEKNHAVRPVSLGRWLAFRADAWFGDDPPRTLRRVSGPKMGGQRWKIETA
jgi:hypothetical protein